MLEVIKQSYHRNVIAAMTVLMVQTVIKKRVLRVIAPECIQKVFTHLLLKIKTDKKLQ